MHPSCLCSPPQLVVLFVAATSQPAQSSAAQTFFLWAETYWSSFFSEQLFFIWSPKTLLLLQTYYQRDQIWPSIILTWSFAGNRLALLLVRIERERVRREAWLVVIVIFSCLRPPLWEVWREVCHLWLLCQTLHPRQDLWWVQLRELSGNIPS